MCYTWELLLKYVTNEACIQRNCVCVRFTYSIVPSKTRLIYRLCCNTFISARLEIKRL